MEKWFMNMIEVAGHWCCTPLIPALGKQRQADICEFKVNLVYKVSSRTAYVVT